LKAKRRKTSTEFDLQRRRKEASTFVYLYLIIHENKEKHPQINHSTTEHRKDPQIFVYF
jgi:hypothetical protein